MQKIITVGLDLAKSIFQVHGIADDGSIVVRRALRRSQVLDFFRSIDPCRDRGVCKLALLGECHRATRAYGQVDAAGLREGLR